MNIQDTDTIQAGGDPLQQPSSDWRNVAEERSVQKKSDWRNEAQSRQASQQSGMSMQDRVNAKIADRNAKSQNMQPAKENNEPGFLGQMHQAITGNGRKSPDIKEFDLPFEFSARQAKTAFGLMTTFDDKREMSILKENYPDLKFSEDEFGNVLVDGAAYGGKRGYLNKPGITLRDVADIGFQVAAFLPAGLAGTGAKTMVSGMARVGTASAVTQSGMDLAGQSVGGEEEVSVGNIDKSDVLTAGLGGAAFEGLGIIASKMVPQLTKSAGVVTAKIRESFISEGKKHGVPPEQISDDVIDSFMESAKNSIPPEKMAASQQFDEFGIPLTVGQITNSVKQLNVEDTMRHGGGGAKAEEIMKSFEKDIQSPAIRSARATALSNFSKGSEPLDSPVEMGGIIKEGVKKESLALEGEIQEAYESVGNAYLSPDSMGKLADATINASKKFINDPDLAPATVKFVQEVTKFKSFIDGSGTTINPTHINKIEEMRRKIGSYIDASKNRTDRRQMTIMKRQFDTFLDKAVDSALFSGDQSALDALKNARKLRAIYAKNFQRNDVLTKGGRKLKDETGDVMERIVSADPTNEQVVNYIFGASKIGGKQAGPKIVKKLKDVLGKDSAEWGSVRQAAFLKLTEPRKGSDVISGNIFSGRLDQALRESPTLLNELFTKKEHGMMMRLASAIKRSQPEIKNPSKTAYKASEIANQTLLRIATSLGFTLGGIGGAATGAAAARVGGGGLAQMRNSRKALKAVKGSLYPLRRLNAGGVGAVTATASSDRDE